MPAYGKHPYKTRTKRRRKKAAEISILDAGAPFLKAYRLRMKRALFICLLLFSTAMVVVFDLTKHPRVQEMNIFSGVNLNADKLLNSVSKQDKQKLERSKTLTEITVSRKIWFYDSPSDKAKAAGFLGAGDTVDIKQETNNWYLINLGYRTAWILKADI